MPTLTLKRVQNVVKEFYNYVRPIKNLDTAKGDIDDLDLPYALYIALFDSYKFHYYQIDSAMRWAFRYANGLGWDPDDLSSYIHKVYTDDPHEGYLFDPRSNAAHISANMVLMTRNMKKGFNKEEQILNLKDIFFRMIEMEKHEDVCCIYAFTREKIREVSHPFCLRPDLDGTLLKLTSQLEVEGSLNATYGELVEAERAYRDTFQNIRKNYLAKCNTPEKMYMRQQLFNLFDQKLVRMFLFYMNTSEDRDKLGYEFETMNIFLDEGNPNLMYIKACMYYNRPRETDSRYSMVISFLALLNFASHLGVDLVEEHLTELANQDDEEMINQNGWRL